MANSRHFTHYQASLAKRMQKYRTFVELDDDDDFDNSLCQFRFSPSREQYLRNNWVFIKRHLARHNINVMIKFKSGIIGYNEIHKDNNASTILRGRTILRLLTYNIPYEYSARILRRKTQASFIKAGSMFKNIENYYKRRQLFLEPDPRTLTYIELLTNCNVLLDKKMIIIIGPANGVQKATCIAWHALVKSQHPIEQLKQLMTPYIQRNKSPKINIEDWEDYCRKCCIPRCKM